MLNKSRLLSFIDNNKEFTLHFVEGQKLVEDLALIHGLKGSAFAYFRDSVLSFIPLITLLKSGETLGLYIDNSAPYFRLKIEMSEAGYFRSLLLPEELNEFPTKLKGEARLSKVSRSQTTPYTSIIDIDDFNFHEVVNEILKTSYQLKGRIILSEDSDQAAFIMQLPQKDWDKNDESQGLPHIDQFVKEITPQLDILFKKGTNNEDEVRTFFSQRDFTYLIGRDLDFKCNCSLERMVGGVQSLVNSNGIEDIFEGKESIETRCDYCKTFYKIPRSTFLKN